MKTNKTLGLFAVALTALACALPRTTSAAGDVRSIEFYPEPEGGELGVVQNLDRPLVAGDKVKFKIRLANREQNVTESTSKSYVNPWMLRSLAGAGSISNRLPQVGVRVSGRLGYAEILSWDLTDDKYHTDLICQYTVQAGDFALPLKLANTRGTAAAMEGDKDNPAVVPESSNYYLSNYNLWGFFPQNPTDNVTSNRLEFYFGPEVLDWNEYPGSETYYRNNLDKRDYDLSGANIQILAVDFDDTYVSNNVWRAVAAGTTTATPAAPRLKIPGGASGSYTYYVWTKDPSVAEVEGGVAKTFKDITGAPVTHQVATITVNANDEFVPFTIRAGDSSQVGKTTEVYMSDTPSNICNRAGTLISNFTTRVISIIPPPPPSFKVVVDPVDGIVTTSTNNYLSVATLDVELSETWDHDVTILLTPTMKSGSGTDPFTYIGMSTAMSGTEYYDGQVVALTVKAGNTKASEGGTMLYVYANRADADTAKGIRFTPSIDPASATAAAATAFFTGEKTPATLQINASKPVITMPAEGEEFSNIPANTLYDFTIGVADAMWDLHGKTADDGKYTVYIDFNGSGTFEAISNLTANASGEITFQYRYVVGGRDYNSKIYVVNQDGVSSGKENARSYMVHVKAAKKVAVTPDHKNKNYCEGETAEFQFTFSEPFDYATDGFLFLEPADAQSRDLVECDAFSYGIPIGVGETIPAGSAYLTMKDGWKNAAFKYNVVVRSTDDPTDDTNIISVWGSDGMTIYATNAVPSVISVSMNNTPAYTTGETLTAKAAVGVQNMFEISAWDESYEVDLEDADFETVVKFWENGAVAKTVTLSGNPYGQQIPYTFSTGGDGVKNKVTVHVYDKDMTAAEKLVVDKNPFTVFVETRDAPAISLSPYNSSTYFLESDTGNTKGRIYVDLTVPPTGLGTGHITVHLDVERIGLNDGSEPVLSSYDLEFKNNIDRQSFYLAELDGTPQSESKGFRIRASVVDQTPSPDATKTWAQYYDPCTDFIIFIENESPIIGPGVASTNEIPVAINVPYNITWTASDIDADQEQLEVTWTYNGGSETTTENMKNRTATKAITFTSSGSKKVNLMVRDKDGGLDTREYYFYVAPSKVVEIYPRRPTRGKIGSLSSKYVGAAGIGAGRVWANGANAPTEVSSFVHTWSYSPEDLSMTVYARGYKIGDEDNGTLLPAKDFALDPGGNYHAAAADYAGYYTYTGSDYGNKNSYFYCWLVGSNEGGSFEITHLNNVVSPEVDGVDGFAMGEGKVTLPEYDESAVTYAHTVLEAIFSREYLKGDNLGDINQDGIPDVYAADVDWMHGKLYEAAGYALEDGGDLKNLANWNGDNAVTAAAEGETGDFLPSKTAQGGVLIPSSESWTTSGGAFIARTEIRGFDEHLNYRARNDDLNRNVRGPWISEPCFSEAESNAIARVGGVDLSDAAAFQAYLDRDDSWIPENRCDPTTDDTDGDGFPDGYEYYFWYSAMVGEMKDGKPVRMTGSKFRLDNIAQGEVISADDIAKAFDPTKASGDDANTRDTDNDGLTDMEEFALGTNPVNWDSDGDGMSDFWEIMNGMNPLKADKANGAEMNADGDFMARWDSDKSYGLAELVLQTLDDQGAVEEETPLGLFAFANNASGVIVEPSAPAADPADPADPTQAPAAPAADQPEFVIADGVEKIAALPVFHYGDDKSVCIPTNCGIYAEGKVETKPLENMVEIKIEEGSKIAVKSFKKNQAIALIHDQVYAQFGFDPRTAWMKLDTEYVANRWDKSKNDAARHAGEAGRAVNTVKYTALDEYLVLKYRYMTGKNNFKLAEDKGKWSKRKFAEVLLGGTTKPNVPWRSDSFGDYSDETHGADTDGDGVPDGWELYVAHNPNDDGHDSDDTKDNDGDNLALAAEFAGTDSCNAYQGVESIYKNHPGNAKGWFNKFFPTDPAEKDTDGDGISDGDEGSSWKAIVVYGNAAQPGGLQDYTFIYGTPEDDGSLCIRGGGLNPCTVDTDGDLLPDPWEREFAGVVNGKGLSTQSLELALRSDGLDYLPANPIIMAGMDGTWAQDAYSRGGESDQTIDPRTYTVRDYDFDHDGLQNFQEYLVQTLRHIRYDDGETPLMGSWMPDGSPASRKFVAFTPMNYMDGETYFARVKSLGFNATGAWNFKDLGYFARPARDWDPIALNDTTKGVVNYDEMGYRIMLPPNCLWGDGSRVQAAGYCCTDPRMWDTDGDGMDDFYEIFHGLNPLLGAVTEGSSTGSLAYDVIAQKYGGYFAHWMNAWTGWPMMPPMETQFDAMLYPWMNGTPEFDADGDGLRNAEEAIFMNLTSPSTTHTDPTPLWYTDSTALNGASYVCQYYAWDPDAMSADFNAYPWGWAIGSKLTAEGATGGYSFSFEENEGYDTDHDGIADTDERTLSSSNVTDPLDFSDPDRRQVIWFPGVNSAAVSGRAGTFNRAVYGSADFLRQFTVEAWIRAEDLSREQVVLERTCLYSADTMTNNVSKVRANFRIGITAEGAVYGQFDTSDAVDSGKGVGSPKVVGPVLAAETWTHVAISYDGKALRLFVNGAERNSIATSLIPANGVLVMAQEANIGSNLDLLNGYTTLDAAVVLGATALDRTAIVVSKDSTWKSYGSFYKGSLDEVRVWDGVRSSEEIRQDYKKRYSSAEVKELRETIYAAWKTGATRNDNDSAAMLPPELVLHYNFQTLPGAVQAKDVMKEVSGFTKNVLDQVRVDGGEIPGDLYCGWWKQTPVHSTVYSNYRWVPWIPNTCGHLPFMDGSAPDSHYWSERFGGVCAASETGLRQDAFTFPNAMNPYPYYNYMSERTYHTLRLDRLANLRVAGADEANSRWRFQLESAIVGSSDLVPLGGAFAKRGTEFWDGLGPDDAWTSTFRDVNGDGVPDWWEKVAKNNYGAPDGFDWNTLVDYNGVQMTARMAYLLDLAKGMLPDGMVNVAYENQVDENGNGFLDWWEKLYGISPEDNTSDVDNDGLTDYEEYLVYKDGVLGDGVFLDPTRPYTDGMIYDYFRTVEIDGFRYYLGELYTDHDFMDDAWERKFDVIRGWNKNVREGAYELDGNYVNPYVWDANGDPDGDGWSNLAEARAFTDPTLEKTLSLVTASTGEDHALECHPVPTVRTKLVYNGVSDAFNGVLVVKAWKGSKLNGIPDAKWTINGPNSKSAVHTRFLGLNDGSVKRFTLGSGMIAKEHVSIQFFDPYLQTWRREEESETTTVGDKSVTRKWYIWRLASIASIDTSIWVTFDGDVPRDRSEQDGDYIGYFNRGGQIDYRTGEVVIDLSKYQDEPAYIGIDENSEYRLWQPRSYVRVMWSSRVVDSGNTKEVYLGRADEDTVSTHGYLREGLNTFIAFADANGDGEWTPGEPFGVVRNVDVGWDTVADLTIEMTDDTTAARFAVMGETEQIVRVLRTQINGKDLAQKRTVSSGRYDLGVRNWFTEADFVKPGEFDFDWKNLVEDARTQMRLAPSGIETATYEVYIGSSDEPATTFTREFESTRGKAVPVSPTRASNYLLKSARPTFTWTGDEKNTAFLLQIAEDSDFANIVWQSGTNFLSSGRSYVAPAYVGEELKDGKVYFWRVAEFNSQYKTIEDSDWSPVAEFKTDVDSSKLNTGYGRLGVEVRYYGAATNDPSSIVVGVYETADFTGTPVARAHLKSDSLDDLAVVKQDWNTPVLNAFFDGVKSGNYYVMAFIDANGNGVRDVWESWGYLNKTAMGVADRYTPVTLHVDAESAKTEVGLVFIEDTDANQNEIPDCIEDASIWNAGTGDSGAGGGGGGGTPGDVATGGDVDEDGLQASEEDELGTDSSKWDTDGDGMPDGWEVWAGNDPLYNDASIVVDGDVMAYAETKMRVVCFWDGVNPASKTDWYLIDSTAIGTVTPGARADSVGALRETYQYGQAYGYGAKVETPTDGYVYDSKVVTVAFVHAQVYARFGFDATTANPKATKTEVSEGYTNIVYGVNTKPFTALDKYMLVKYFEALGFVDEADVNTNRLWATCTLRPGEIDGDHDGVPDGWELYVMDGDLNVAGHQPAIRISPWDDTPEAVRTDDFDGDGLTTIEEYNNGVATLDPWSPDTDDDGVDDGDARDFGVAAGGYTDDDDGDQLSNFDELIISRGFGLADVSSTNAHSVASIVPDYFLPAGRLYLGEMFTDHDFMEDAWEDKYPAEYTSRALYDPWADYDGDGWCNFSECRACLSGGTFSVTNGFATNIVSRSFTVGEDEAAETFVQKCKANGTFISIKEYSVSAGSLEDLDQMVDKTVTYYEIHPITEPAYIYEVKGGVPAPTIDLSVAYNGNAISQYYIVCAWSKNSSTLDLPDARWAVPVSNETMRTVFRDARSFKLGRCEPASARSKARLREGLNTFVVYGADTETASWTSGKPYGVARNVDVGWSAAKVSVEITDLTPVMARFSLVDAIGKAEFASANAATDRGVVGARMGYAENVAELYVGTNMTESASSAKPGSTRVRIVRNYINDTASSAYTDVVWDGYVDLAAHPALTEADVLGDGQYDLDWGTVATAYTGGRGSAKPMTRVSYRLVIGNDPIIGTIENHDNNLPIQFVNVFEDANAQSKTVPLDVEQIVYGARPIFRWTHPNTIGKTYPAFQLKIWRQNDDGSAGAQIYDSGVLPAPACTMDGVYTWTAPICAGMALLDGTVFEPENNYLWAVSMLDAKFTTFNSAETKSVFRLNTSDNFRYGHGHGSLRVAVKYFGPGKTTENPAEKKGIIRVQAFNTPDFAGDPAGEVYVTNTTSLAATDALDINAVICGLEAGTYYVRAFIDTEADGKKADWESWGYANYVGTNVPENATIYTPMPTVLSVTDLDVKSVVVFMEDADCDNDGFPDIWEMDENGNLKTQGPITGDTYWSKVNPDLDPTLAAYLDLAEKMGLPGASISILASVKAPSDDAVMNAATADLLGEKVPDVNATIESFSLADGIKVTVAAESAGPRLMSMSADTTSYQFRAVLLKADKLDGEWTELDSTAFTVRAGETVKVDTSAFKAKIEEAKTSSSGFFKVVIRK